MKNKIIKNMLILLIVAILLSLSIAFSSIAYLERFAKVAPKAQSTAATQKEHLITIASGDGLRNIAKKLEELEVISNQYLFIALAKYRGSNKKIKAGEYAFSSLDTPEKILDMLVKGKVKLHKITIPEGLNFREIAQLVQKAGFGRSEDFIKLVKDQNFIASLKIIGSTKFEAESLEGYLFPETYLFPAGVDQKKIISTMVNGFSKVFSPDWIEECRKIGFSVHQIVTLASIIEKETANSDERGLISSVFHNRLKLGMRLESDPTVIYEIPNFNGNITKNHLKTPTPYNTYAIFGLPPGPIANPGRFSLQAAIYPQKSDFIFFVSKNDTTHHFSTNLQEHNRAVRKYQLRKIEP
ncbi:MAG: endolytic transglycosylase MltG [Desulfamplus sp.]|nr:endolytic transglycosylase MltG [Desulfamplus sp.]